MQIEPSAQWLTYKEAAAHTSHSVGHFRNLVSVGQIPVYGPPRRRRFRRDMLDLWVKDPEAAMRTFHLEREAAKRDSEESCQHRFKVSGNARQGQGE